MTVNFAVPGFWTHQHLILACLRVQMMHPEYFYDNVCINAAFGTVPFCTWDGGRSIRKNATKYCRYATTEELEKLRDIYDYYNVKIRFTFTNSLIDEKSILDRYNNTILSIFDNNNNEIVLNSTLLEDYINNNYNYKLVSSTTKCLTNQTDALNEIKNDKYKYICIDYNLNKNTKFLETIPEEYRHKVEFLINAICPPGCQYRKEHYYKNSIYGLTYGAHFLVPNCGIVEKTTLSLHSKNTLSPEDIFEYVKNGFINFKIEGRTLSETEVLLNLVQYLIKPDYMCEAALEINNIMSTYSLDDTYNIFN